MRNKDKVKRPERTRTENTRHKKVSCHIKEGSQQRFTKINIKLKSEDVKRLKVVFCSEVEEKRVVETSD